MSDDTVLERAKRWIQDDPDSTTRAELEGLIERGASDELAERFAGPLTFGTAGLRGILGAGETRMNRAVVIRASYGLGKRLLTDHPDGARVVVGYDGRRLSREFAEDTAGVLTAQGHTVVLTEGVVPTPVVAFGVLREQAQAGVMVTASHNPPQYNGYKVYWGNGAQIVPPVDSEIAIEISAAPAATEVPQLSLEEARARGRLIDAGAELEAAYLEGVSGLSLGVTGDRGLTVVYTAMHGVGGKLVQDALTRAGFEDVHVVAEQFEPDGDFPTVAFPNPEEDGALDLVLALAEEVGADVILANDPDADRLACCARGADGMVQLTGNELGVVLGHYLLTEGPQTGERLVLNSVVSSPQLGGIATKLGARWTETLTGFKWIANTAMSQEAAQPGARFVFGYEEALGYCVGSLVRDKDGISAAVALCELAASLKAKGETLLDRLAAIAREYGVYTSRQRSTVFPGASGAERMQEIMAGLRRTPPLTIGALSVVATTDFQEGVRKAGGEETKLDFPPSDVMAFELEGGSRVIARPSGTEPKIKFYVDVCVTLGEGESLEAARERAETLAGELDEAFAQATGVLDAS